MMKGIVWVSSTVWVGEKQLDERGVSDEGSSSGELEGMGKGGGGGGGGGAQSRMVARGER